VAGALAAFRAGAPEVLELALYDARAEVVARRHPASPGVVLVAVDDDAVRIAGGVHPLPRGALAAVVEEARRAGARALALDFILEDPLEGSLASENAELERAIGGGGVALAVAMPRSTAAGGGRSPPSPVEPPLDAIFGRHARDLGGRALAARFDLSPPLPRFALAAAALGGVSQAPAANGRVYALQQVYPTDRGDFPSLALAAATLASGSTGPVAGGGALRLGDRRVAIDGAGRSYLRWYGYHDGRPEGASTYPVVSAGALLRARLAREGEGSPPPAEALAPLRGAVAVVCETLAGTKDRAPSPVNPGAVGGEVVANAVDNLLRGESVRRLSPWSDAAVAFGLSVASALLVALAGAGAMRPSVAMAISGAATGALLAGWWGISTTAIEHGLWLPAFAPLVGGILAAFAADLRLLELERRDRRFVHDALGRYTSPALVAELLRNRELLDRFGGTRQELTVYFSDIRGFTAFSEGMDPEALVALLNEYLSEMSALVERHGGYVDKYVGDAVMAVWGAPVPAADHALRACAAAVEMRDRLRELRPAWKERFGVEIRAGAGLNTGPMVAGNIGSRQKTNYTVLGDAVNLASRLESATKVYGVEILVGDSTRAAAGDAVVTRLVDVLQVKGRTHGVAVHELVALAGALDERQRDVVARWERAMAPYRERRFEEALAAFEGLLRDHPEDGPARVYVGRCRELLASPPPAAWDGVHVLHEK
jgi:adenylate cyclase